MGPPVSRILAFFFLEFLKSGLFQFVIPQDSDYCIDDILFIYPQNNDSTKITDRLNNVEPTIDFT